MELNHNIPHFKCLVRQFYFTKNEEHRDIFNNCYAFAIQSIPAKILTFHVITDYGMVRSRVPISEIYLKEPTNDVPFYFKQLWDCFAHLLQVYNCSTSLFLLSIFLVPFFGKTAVSSRFLKRHV